MDASLLQDIMRLQQQGLWSRGQEIILFSGYVCVLDKLTTLGCAKFVGKDGIKKPSDLQASELTFDRKSEHMGKYSDSIRWLEPQYNDHLGTGGCFVYWK